MNIFYKICFLKKILILINNLFLLFNLIFSKFFLIFYILKFDISLKKKNKKLIILNAQQFGSLLSSLKFSLCEFDKKKISENKIIYLLPKKIINKELISFLKYNYKVYSNDKIYDKFRKAPLLLTKNIYNFKTHNGWLDLKNKNFNFKFSNQELQKVKQFLKINNIKNKFVCISNRDNFFYNDKDTITNYRNSNFNNYKSTLEFLKRERNFDVVRTGDYLDEKNICYVSLMNEQFKKLLDICLPYFCEFSINTSSGLAYVPFLYNKPQLICNAIPLGELPSIHRGIILPKIIKNLESEKILKINDLLKLKVFKINEFNLRSYNKSFFINPDATRFQSDFYYKEKRLKVEDNTETEILIATKELIAHIIEEKKLTNIQIKKQNKFKKLFPINHPIRKTRALISPYWLDNYLHYLS